MPRSVWQDSGLFGPTELPINSFARLPVDVIAPEFAADVRAIQQLAVIPKILDVVSQLTGLGFVAVARVTEERWVTCAVLDKIAFGLNPGDELNIETTICRDVRLARESIVIDHVAMDDRYRTHPTPALYGFQSYISVPIVLPDGDLFGTLCAIDMKPASLRASPAAATFQLMADLIGQHLSDAARLAQAEQRNEEINELLRQSRKMEAVGQLTAGLAHDFNNSLVGVTGSLELIERRLAQGRLAEIGAYLLSGKDAVRRATGLAARLLAFSRKHDPESEAIDVGQVVAGMEEIVRRTVGSRIDVTTTLHEGNWRAWVNANQLESVILNLCINARDAMPDGGKLEIVVGQVRADVGASEDASSAQDYLSLCVADTGTGMPPDVSQRMLEPFFTTKAAGVGTGMGLAMVSEFLRQVGGDIRIKSSVGHGTVITLLLPRHPEP